MHNDSPSSKNYKVRVLIETVVEVPEGLREAFEKRAREAVGMELDEFVVVSTEWCLVNNEPVRVKFEE